MNRFRFLLVALSTLALASMVSAASPIDTRSGVPGNGLAEPAPIDSTDSTELTAGAAFCNKLCIIGYHCVPTPSGGRCVPGNGLAGAAPTAATETVELIGDHCVANANSGELMASNAPRQCGACTILCPYGTHLVQKHNCDCVCVGNAG